jgi:fructose-bisphosphate aldolase class 1
MKRKEEAGFSLPLTFSFARAFQAPALEAWAGKTENIPTAREAFYARLVANRDAF